MSGVNVAIVGATGAVGGALIEALDEADLVDGELYLLASAASSGDTAMYRKRAAMIADVADFDFSLVDLVFFAVPEDVSRQYAQSAVAVGCRVIDFSCCFRDDLTVPLIVAGINSDILDDGAHLVALPDSLAVDLSHVLKPIHDDVEVVRVNVATYQAVSSAGQAGVKELASQSTNLLGGVTVKPKVFGKQIAFNVLPQVGELLESGHADAELRMVSEVRRIVGGAALAMSVTCVQVPVFYGFCQAVSLETRYPLDVERVIELLKQVDDLKIVTASSKQGYPVPVTGSGVLSARSVGRIRASIGVENGIDLWIVSDNVRKGAVDNAINVAKLLLKGAQQ